MAISKDMLGRFDPCVKTIRVVSTMINILLHPNTSVVTFTEEELSVMLKLLQENKQ